MIASMPNDAEVEEWFFRHREEAASLSERALLPIAPWIPLIGLPANDDQLAD